MLFDVGDKLSFEIPLTNVSQCTQNKDEVALEFHQNDDSELSLMEMRFYIPPSQDEYVDRVQVYLHNYLHIKIVCTCTFLKAYICYIVNMYQLS